MPGGFDVGGMVGRLDGFGKDFGAAIMDAVEAVADHVLAEASQEVPHEDGDLQASGKVSTDPSTNRAAVSYDTPYAVVQHEDMTMQHDAGRRAKYLEGPMNRAANGAAQRIIQDVLGRKFGR